MQVNSESIVAKERANGMLQEAIRALDKNEVLHYQLCCLFLVRQAFISRWLVEYDSPPPEFLNLKDIAQQLVEDLDWKLSDIHKITLDKLSAVEAVYPMAKSISESEQERGHLIPLAFHLATRFVSLSGAPR